jgi:hypothetical protein
MEILVPANDEVESPIVPIEFNGETIVLTYFNTRLRTFPDEQYNHTEFFDDSNDLRATGSKQLLDVLFELDFPMLSLPYVDEDTMVWFISMQTSDLEDADPDMFSNGTDDMFE